METTTRRNPRVVLIMAILAVVLLVVAALTTAPSADAETSRFYNTIWSLLPPLSPSPSLW